MKSGCVIHIHSEKENIPQNQDVSFTCTVKRRTSPQNQDVLFTFTLRRRTSHEVKVCYSHPYYHGKHPLKSGCGCKGK